MIHTHTHDCGWGRVRASAGVLACKGALLHHQWWPATDGAREFANALRLVAVCHITHRVFHHLLNPAAAIGPCLGRLWRLLPLGQSLLVTSVFATM